MLSSHRNKQPLPPNARSMPLEKEYICEETFSYILESQHQSLPNTAERCPCMRAGKDGQTNRAPSGGYNNDRGNSGGNFGGNFRGRGAGYNNRGNMNNNMNNFNRNNSFNPGMGNMGGGFNAPMGGFPATRWAETSGDSITAAA
jgi:hypothetical protein